MFKNLRQLYLIKIEFSFSSGVYPTGRQYIVYVVPLGFEEDPMAARTFDASGEEAGWL